MQLRSLIPALTPLKIEGSLAAQVTGLEFEPRRVAPGNVFFALPRAGYDGHSQIETAVARGASAIVCRQRGAMKQRAALIEVADTREALAKASAFYFGRAGERLRVIGVTGHAGAWKSAFLLASLLRASGIKTGLISSFRHEVGERRLPSGAPPESADIQRLFAEMTRAGCDTCVLEVPDVSPAALREVPLDLLVVAGEEENFWKYSDYMHHAISRRPGCAIVNLDARAGRETACSALFDSQVTFGRSSAAQVSAQDVSFSPQSTAGILYIGNESASFSLPLAGRENLGHLLAATAAAFALDIPARAIFDSLDGISAPPGSLELISEAGRFHVYVDEARDESNLESALRSLREITTGRVLLALGAGERTTGRERFQLGRMAAQHAHYVVLTSDNPGRESVEQICGALAQGLENGGNTRYHFQPDRAEAIGELIRLARAGDALLISGKGDRTFQQLVNTIVPFDDRRVARERLRQNHFPRNRIEKGALVPA